MPEILENLSLRQVRAFRAVARAGSFVAAAAELHLTPSALSDTIKQLEQGVGARLIDRTTRALWLTPAGEAFLASAEESLQVLSRGIAGLRELGSPDAGHVTVAAAPSVMATLVLPGLRAVRAAYPRMTFALLEERAQGIVAAVAAGAADFGVGGWHPDAQALDAATLLADRFGVLAPHGHPLLGRKRLRGIDLVAHPVIGFTGDTAINALIRAEAGLPVHVREPSLRVSSTALIQQAVTDGLGVAVLPALLARHPMSAALAFQVLDQPVLSRTIHLFTRPARTLSPAAVVVKDAVLRAAAELRVGQGLSRPGFAYSAAKPSRTSAASARARRTP
jgi:DNA-binding transcriptional LysR family regulator